MLALISFANSAFAYPESSHRVMSQTAVTRSRAARAMASLEKDFSRVGKASAETRGSDLLSPTDCGSLAEFRRAYEGMRDRTP